MKRNCIPVERRLNNAEHLRPAPQISPGRRAYNIKYQPRIYQDYEEHKTENAIPVV